MKVEEPFSPAPEDETYYLSLERFAEWLGMSDQPEVLEAWIASGKLPMREIAGHRLVDLRAFLRAEGKPKP
ncbi:MULTISPECIES: DNA-binding protein [unclassified Pseudomonas]|uniref:DNA-binding protein n=1 Tax=unclassified Pseudomonas TaxID=196821 RepID=UPI000D704A99|nr:MULTISPECIES: DNA-binding protein [unclassified Pseudomonas]MED5610251.1 DNA-binding protein [Pseudomonas sp. JH-2]PWU27630.1 DNA-binding protein [Pseudomonas sp. RW407]